MASIRRHGSGWQVRVRRKGHPTRVKTFPKKILAEAWARKIEEEVSKNLHLNDLATSTTVLEIMEKYRAQITPRKKSAAVEQFRINTVIQYLGEYTLDALTPNVVIEFVDDRLEHVSSDSVRKELGVLSLAIDAAMALWNIELPANPVHTAKNILRVTKTLKSGNKRDRRPTDEELTLLYNNTPGLMPLIIEFAVETAMRRGEIANQRREHRDGNTLHIPETKTDTPRTIPLSQRACDVLDSLPSREDGFVWCTRPAYITRAFCRACAKLGIEDLRFHDLRHEAASRFFERGLNVAEVAKITGQTFDTLQRYTHLKAKDIAGKLEVVS